MKKLTSLAVLASYALFMGLVYFTVPAKADEIKAVGDDQLKNLKTGYNNTATGWVEVIDSASKEAAQGKGMGEQLTGVGAGSVVGARKAIHRMGAGAIDLLTFWIPKKKPLIDPEKPTLK